MNRTYFYFTFDVRNKQCFKNGYFVEYCIYEEVVYSILNDKQTKCFLNSKILSLLKKNSFNSLFAPFFCSFFHQPKPWRIVNNLFMGNSKVASRQFSKR